MKNKVRILMVFCLLQAAPIFSSEGFFKDYFHDIGYHLSGQKHNDHVKKLLNYSIEPNFTNTLSSAQVYTRNRISGTPLDSNGVLLYPDNSPRFRVYYHTGGRFSHLMDCDADTARIYGRLRAFFRNGGSWVGSCAGAGAASLKSYPSSAQPSMVGLWPYSYNDRGCTYYSQVEISDMSSPIAQYYCGFLGYRDSIVDSVRFNSGGYFSVFPDPFTEYIGKSLTSGADCSNKWVVISHKDTTKVHSGRVVITGGHPEGRLANTKQGKFFAAMVKYAAESNGKPRIKAELQNNVPRVMNDNSTEGFEKIGDLQYHHFTINVPAEAETLSITLEGEDTYDFNLYLRKGDCAYASLALKRDTGTGSEKSLKLTRATGLSAGTWYVGVECATQVTVTQVRSRPCIDSASANFGIDSVQYDTYLGRTAVLNGIEYSIRARLVTGTGTGVSQARTGELPQSYALFAAPNPFNPVVTFSYQLPRAAHVTISVYDGQGRQVAGLVDEPRAEGSYRVSWNASYDRRDPAASGLYFVRMAAGDFQRSRPILFLK